MVTRWQSHSSVSLCTATDRSNVCAAESYTNLLLTHQFFYFHTLIWLPLWLGAWHCCWGTVASFPDALRLKRSKTGTQLHEYLLRPVFYNLACWGAPVVLLASILPLAVLSQNCMNIAQREYRVWQEQSRAARFAGLENPEALRSLYESATAIWLRSTRAWWLYSLDMLIWIIWAGFAFATYAPIGFHTMRRVKEAVGVAAAKTRREQAQTFYLFTSRPEDAPRPDAPSVMPTSGKETHGFDEPHLIGESSPSPPKPVWSKRVERQPSRAGAAEIRWASVEDLGRLPCDDAEDAVISRLIAQQTQSRSGGTGVPPLSSVYPPLKPGPSRSKKLGPAARRHKTLRRIYRNLVILVSGVSVAILCFLGITAYIAAQQYEATRQGGIPTGHVQVAANLWAAWVNFGFGFLTIGAVFWRSFDSSLTLRAEESVATFPAMRDPNSDTDDKSIIGRIRQRFLQKGVKAQKGPLDRSEHPSDGSSTPPTSIIARSGPQKNQPSWGRGDVINLHTTEAGADGLGIQSGNDGPALHPSSPTVVQHDETGSPAASRSARKGSDGFTVNSFLGVLRGGDAPTWRPDASAVGETSTIGAGAYGLEAGLTPRPVTPTRDMPIARRWSRHTSLTSSDDHAQSGSYGHAGSSPRTMDRVTTSKLPESPSTYRSAQTTRNSTGVDENVQTPVRQSSQTHHNKMSMGQQTTPAVEIRRQRSHPFANAAVHQKDDRKRDEQRGGDEAAQFAGPTDAVLNALTSEVETSVSRFSSWRKNSNAGFSQPEPSSPAEQQQQPQQQQQQPQQQQQQQQQPRRPRELPSSSSQSRLRLPKRNSLRGAARPDTAASLAGSLRFGE